MAAMIRKTVVLVAVALTAFAAGAAETRRYSVVGGGTQVVETDGDRIRVRLQVRDADLQTETRVDDRGLPTLVTVKGKVFQGSVVERRFERERVDAFHISIAQAPEERALLARALLRAKEQRLPLLPYGQARLERVLEQTFGDERVTLYAIFGLTHSPEYLWLEHDGQLFASHEWYGTVARAGAEAHTRALEAAQQKAVEQWRAALLARIEKKPATIAITNARLFDPQTGRVTPNATIVVEGDRIARVGTVVAIPQGAQRIDAAGKMVMPGLWDMHRHIGDESLLFDLAAGVTTIRDLSSGLQRTTQIREDVAKGRRAGPRILTSQLVAAPSTTIEQARVKVDECVSLRCDQVKIYSAFPYSLIAPVARYVHEKGLRVSGHIPAGTIASHAVAEGLDEIHHINQVMLNFMPDAKRTDTPLRFTAVGERGAGIDPRSKKVRAFIAQLRERGTVVDPTVNVFELMFTTRRGDASPAMRKAGTLFPPQRFVTASEYRLVPVEGDDMPRYKASFRRMLELIAALHKAGVTIVAGTDASAGASLHRELELYVEAGLSPIDALRSATIVPAQVMNRERELGRVAPGMLADFVIVDGDPTRNISDVRRIVTVVKEGAIYDPAAIYREMSVGD